MRKDFFFVSDRFDEIPPDYDEIRLLLQDKDDPPSMEDLVALAYWVVASCDSEIEDILEDEDKAMNERNAHSKFVLSSLELLLAFGMDPNQYFDNGDNAMSRATEMEYGTCGAKIIKFLLENGGDPNQELADTTLFDHVSWALVRWGECYENRVQCWLVLLAYGGTPRDKSFSVKIKEGFDISRFKEYESFTYNVVKLEPERRDINNLHCRLTIYDENHEEVATLE